MPICISCSTPVRNLYTTYSKADDRSLGKGVRLTQCPNCKRFADKYVEHDFVVLFIDLVLIKPQVRPDSDVALMWTEATDLSLLGISTSTIQSARSVRWRGEQARRTRSIDHTARSSSDLVRRLFDVGEDREGERYSTRNDSYRCADLGSVSLLPDTECSGDFGAACCCAYTCTSLRRPFRQTDGVRCVAIASGCAHSRGQFSAASQ